MVESRLTPLEQFFDDRHAFAWFCENVLRKDDELVSQGGDQTDRGEPLPEKERVIDLHQVGQRLRSIDRLNERLAQQGRSFTFPNRLGPKRNDVEIPMSEAPQYRSVLLMGTGVSAQALENCQWVLHEKKITHQVLTTLTRSNQMTADLEVIVMLNGQEIAAISHYDPRLMTEAGPSTELERLRFVVTLPEVAGHIPTMEALLLVGSPRQLLAESFTSMETLNTEHRAFGYSPLQHSFYLVQPV